MTNQIPKSVLSQKSKSNSSRLPSDSKIPIRSSSTLSNNFDISKNRKSLSTVIKKAAPGKRLLPKKAMTNNLSSLKMPLLTKPPSNISRFEELSKPLQEVTSASLKKNTFNETSNVAQDLNHHQKNLNMVHAEVTHYQEMKNDIEQELFLKNNHLNEARAKIEQLQQEMKTKSEAYKDGIRRLHNKFQRENNELLHRYKATKDAYNQYELVVEEKKAVISEALQIYEEETKEYTALLAKKREYEKSYANADEYLAQKKQRIDQQKSAISKAEDSLLTISRKLQQIDNNVDRAEGTLLTNEESRRKAHDRVQELKGNIRVFCRVKPRLNTVTDSINGKSTIAEGKKVANTSAADENENYIAFKFFGDDNEGLEFDEITKFGQTKKHIFTYDRVFQPEESQEDCFEEISQLVQSALDGYNVSIFAYGQTGSGKTYTMQGPPRFNAASSTSQNNSNNILHRDAGMIPRAVHQIYDVAKKMKKFNWDYTITGEFLEIYNETIHDLLGEPSEYGKIKHDIMLDSNEKIAVSKLTSVDLHSPEQVQTMLTKAMKNRSTAATKLNHASSRSHCVFTLRITGENTETKETRLGVLNLVDLAGSESVSKSGSEGERFREASNINKSLSYLGNVIQALAKKSSHVPYRDSKLTYLLKDSFGGNCKTLMFVNISQEKRHLKETLFSLRFATTVNSCKVPRAKQN
ncbi:P-loop containing nucleoside triphosphate hydrolase protein [Mycotypha africana]|uniref:P-loop containing nucleoside triphosphate hydrolase protein n=1 Tax=Mycotypha africana TaxID=64632 RepID=UPI0023011B6F|nr:P-loop containing nucleoside triphosphate hydrolase protein [Mycotypha africana]KAI8988176.1 P-loop containing nucleoside triphosphate hydrolase protein [Mycotypha africana]